MKSTLVLLAVVLGLGVLLAAAQTHTFPALDTDPVSWTGAHSFTKQITSSLATGTAPFSIASTTAVTNLNAQLHNGLTAPGSAILGLTDTQAPTNKTFDISLNTVKQATPSAGKYLRDNGTSFQPSSVAAAGAGGCTNQFPRTLNDNATPTCASVSLSLDVTGNLPVGNLNNGTSADNTHFWRGDGSWAIPAVGSAVGHADATGQNASIGASNLVGSTTTGIYRANVFLQANANQSSSTYTVTVTFGGPQTDTSSALTITTASSGNFIQASFVMYATGGAITWATTVTGSVNTGTYDVHVSLEQAH